MSLKISKRSFLKATSTSLASLGLANLAHTNEQTSYLNTMFAPKAKRVIFLFMQGGPSHMDTFDYKPELFKSDRKKIDFTGVRAADFGQSTQRTLMKPMWNFKQHGNCGRWVSELFPNIAKHVDDLCFINSMHTEGVAHGPSTLFMHTGAINSIRPSIGSWISYGLGTENLNLPAFMTIMPSASKGGPRNYSNAFLPASHQATVLGRAGISAKLANINNIVSPQTAELQQKQFNFMQAINHSQFQHHGASDELETLISSYDLANKMQHHAPDLVDLSNESKSTLDMYGIGEKDTDEFGRQCLMARRMAEQNVRFIQVNYSDESVNPKWDQHSNMPKHAEHARATDKPVAGLLEDLKQRGLLEDTLVWWGGEFGRTPFSQGKNGRDHNPRGFTVWFAGGGVKAGHAHGKTDEIGHYAVEKKVHMHDLHATVLHLLGIDHEKLTFNYAGRNFRLTDVHGHVVHDIIA